MKLPRFTLRELFLLVVIAAMGCGWWVQQKREWNRVLKYFSEQEEVNQALKEYINRTEPGLIYVGRDRYGHMSVTIYD